MNRLHAALAEIVTDVPDYGDLDRAIARADLERRRRYGLLAALAAAAVLIVIAGVAATHEKSVAPAPVSPSPTEDATDSSRPDLTPTGRIVRAEKHYRPGAGTCAGCSDVAFLKAYDPALDRALWAFYDLADVADGPTQLGSLSVAGPEGRVAALACPDDFACRPGDDLWGTGATLGPGAEELTIESGDQEVRVMAYDGTVRRSLDLSADLDRDEQIDALAWSPDRSRLVVQTSAHRIWLLGRDGSDPVLVHTAVFPVELLPSGEFGQLTYLSDLSWSPDGRRLGFMEEFTRHGGRCHCELEISSEAVVLRVPGAGEDGPGTATTLYRYARPSPVDDPLEGKPTWSPDGTRMALVAEGGILELSTDDGSILARHPGSLAGPDPDQNLPVSLVWLARQR